MKRHLFVRPRPEIGRGLGALALVLGGSAIAAVTAPAASADHCINTAWSSYSPPQTFIGYAESGWYADGQSGDHKYYRQFRYQSGEYKFRQYNCVTERGNFYQIQYRERVCLYATCGSPTSWYIQRWSGPNYREGVLQNGIPVRW